MGIDLWLVRHEFLKSLDEDEVEFILNFLPDPSDDGTYYIDEEILQKLKEAHPEECQKVSALLKTIENALKENNGHICVALF